MRTSIQNRLPSLPIIFISLFIAVIAVSCGGGGGAAPAPAPAEPTDQDASGIYNGTGKGAFIGVNGNAEVSLTTVKGMVNGSRFIFFNADISDANSNVLFDGTITSITLTNLVGTADVYQGGKIVESDVAVTGVVNGRSSILLTLAASASGNFKGGSVDASFDLLYDRGATNARIDNTLSTGWGRGGIKDVFMIIPNMTTFNFEMRLADDTYQFVTDNPGFTQTCLHVGVVAIPNSAVNLYTVSDSIFAGLGCVPPGTSTGYTGFSTVVDVDNQDDTLWYAVTNGTYSVFAILNE